MGNIKMKLSIIIPSFKRAELLNYGLYSLSKQVMNFSYEVIVLNDGIKDNTELVCNKYKQKLNIKYVFSGQRNLNKKVIWRTPCKVINQGVGIAKGKTIILTSPEIYLLDQCIQSMVDITSTNKKTLTIPNGFDDTTAIFLNYIKRNSGDGKNFKAFRELNNLDTKLPFFIAINRKQFLSIGGYDEDFTGFAFDDADFIKRLNEAGCKYKTIPSRIVHLYHSRKTREGLEPVKKRELWLYNKNLYEKTKEIISTPKKRLPEVVAPKIESFSVKKIIPHPLIIKKNSSSKWELVNIPKIVHFYWGEKTLPYLRYLTIQSFHKYNPDWEIRFYYPKYRTSGRTWKSHEHKYDINISKNYYSLLNKLPMKKIEVDFDILNISNDLSEVHKSDYLRWHLLSIVGGLWSDMDIIYIDSMNSMHINTQTNQNTKSVICYHVPWKHSIGFLLSSTDSPLYKHLKNEAYKRKYDSTDYQTVGSLLMNSSVCSFEEADLHYPNTINVSMDTVYSYNTFLIKTMLDSKNLTYITNNTIGLHWYAGHPKAEKLVSSLNENNYKKINNVVSEVVDMSLNKTKEKVIKYTTSFNFNKTKNNKKLTIHSVIKNEPFIYYSIKSVYNYANKILLYDTGSDDKYTLKDIARLLKEDKEKKIIFKQIPLDFDETKWTYEKVNEFAKKHAGKMSVGKVRQIQIDDTDTEFCMLVDGDEIHYKETMEKIVNDILPYLSENIIGVNIPLIWFYNLNQVFRVPGMENTGRIWRTNEVVMNGISPNEAHCFKSTGRAIAVSDKEYLIYKDLIPYAHFESYLKPWRREIIKSQLSNFKGKLPEVMQENDYYINRYIKTRSKKWAIKYTMVSMKKKK